MSDSTVNAGDVFVDQVTISALNGSSPINIKNQVIEIEIGESIFSPFLEGSLILQDGVSLVNNYPIVGEEKIFINFFLPGVAGNETRSIEVEFAVISVEDVKNGDDNLSSAYIIRMISLEKITDIISGVSNPYNDTVSNIVKKIVKDHLESSKPVEVEETLGAQELLFPNSNATSALNLCSYRAVSPINLSSSYYFFERLNDGFVFKTIEQMIKDSKAADVPEYFYTSQRFASERGNEFFQIRDLVMNRRFDTIEKIIGGLIDSELLQYDIITKKQKSTSFKYRDIFKNVEHVDSDIPSKLNRDSFITSYEDNSQFPGSRVEYSYIIDDSSKPKTHLERSYGHRLMYNSSLAQSNYTLVVPGMPDRKAGELINIRIPSFDGNQDVGSDQEKYISGNFFVTSVKHLIAMHSKFDYYYSTTMDITKDSYLSPIEDYDA